jgi:hypothetical protein
VRTFLLMLAMLIGQSAGAREIVHLPPGKSAILPSYGGKLVELNNAPTAVYLPSKIPPSTQAAWDVEIRNLGPHNVTITSGAQFSTIVHPGETATVALRGSSSYVRTH